MISISPDVFNHCFAKVADDILSSLPVLVIQNDPLAGLTNHWDDKCCPLERGEST